ncbi:TlpA family protein disulfide reductase [Gemmatimonadota bacterium]
MELPHVQEMYAELKEHEDLQIIAVEINDDREGADTFIEENGLTFIFTEANRAFVESKFNTAGYPNSFLIGKDSRIREHWLGFREGQEVTIMEAILKALNNDH